LKTGGLSPSGSDLMTDIPRLRGIDHTLPMLREGYRFIGNRCDEFGADLFAGRIMFTPVVCLRGHAAAELFYSNDRFTRVRAMPITVLTLLQDLGSVQLLDDAPHRQRKSLFVRLCGPDESARIADIMAEEWERCFRQAETGTIRLFDIAREILTRSALRWVGIPFTPAEASRRTREFSEMIEASGSFGPRNWRAQLLRARCERWARQIVEDVRAGKIPASDRSPVHAVASHREADGTLLDVKRCAVELINLLRPTVAVARFIVFAACALDDHPEARQRIASGDDAYLRSFVLEMRRHAPFFPFIGGRARQPLEWSGHRFQEGDWALLDIFGTNRHPREWPRAEAFVPDRFVGHEPDAFTFIPQGGGEVSASHRCPGEHITNALMRRALILLTRMRYHVPEQDLSVDLACIPALPASGYLMSEVRLPG
jgi:fatty-acid peroxygenase